MAERAKNSNTKEKQTNEKTYYPTNDYLFKRIFGYKGNERITEDLIETILGKKCEVIEIKSDEVTEKDLREDKIGVLDVFVKEKDGTQINIEMQVAEYKYIIDRILYYWAKKYIEILQGGDDYKKLKPTKVILITNFEIKKLNVLEDIVNSFKIKDTKTGKLILTENLETSLYKDLMKTTKNFKIASKYKIGKEATTIDAKVDMYLDGKIARALYIRDNDTKLNVVQLKYQIVNNDETPEEIQIEEMMRDFEMECKSNMGVMDLEREPDEVNIKDDNMTYVEKIYNNKELYSARYNVQDEHFTEEDLEDMQIDKNEYTKTYDINYYMDGDNTLVCEFVRIL